MAPMTQDQHLPNDFLANSAPNIKVSRVNWIKVGLPEYNGSYAVVLDNVMTKEECDTLRTVAEFTARDGEWDRAMVNMGQGREHLMTEQRNCGRIIYDSQDAATRIWKRIEHLPEVQEIVSLENVPNIFGNGAANRGEVWRLTRPNERLRFLKYIGGEYFRPHCDGAYMTPDRAERSFFTLHLYLNDGAELSQLNSPIACTAGCVGGATTFHSKDMKYRFDVLPRTGRVLLFQHRSLVHSGDDVANGVKYTVRTDLMFALEERRVEGLGFLRKARSTRRRDGDLRREHKGSRIGGLLRSFRG
ncbi:oxidoreductase domain-containing protein [Teratosphaeria destructans]|uniref:Oxidoreductase domain-containing protein n=1 Tax=Teratosphaeria destructans TaxID=418781 RepID=A0A9W7SI03_9PEZI|nr:oxidoreductase domain-containing protein [Teratosphaeria destructans]